jgi:multisubunit Na+/H+ antiporter MnhE subunit
MDFAPVKKWAVFFIGILCAIVIADALSNVIVSATGMDGWMKFLVSFILYAVFFFAILYALEKIFHIEFFGFWRE